MSQIVFKRAGGIGEVWAGLMTEVEQDTVNAGDAFWNRGELKIDQASGSLNHHVTFEAQPGCKGKKQGQVFFFLLSLKFSVKCTL